MDDPVHDGAGVFRLVQRVEHDARHAVTGFGIRLARPFDKVFDRIGLGNLEDICQVVCCGLRGQVSQIERRVDLINVGHGTDIAISLLVPALRSRLFAVPLVSECDQSAQQGGFSRAAISSKHVKGI